MYLEEPAMIYKKVLLFLLLISLSSHVVQSMEEKIKDGLCHEMEKLSLDKKPPFGWLGNCGLNELQMNAVKKSLTHLKPRRDVYDSKQVAMFNAIKNGNLANFKKMFCGKRYKILGLKTPVRKFLFVRNDLGNTVLHTAIFYRRFAIVKCITQALKGKILYGELCRYAFADAECEQDVIPYIKKLIGNGRRWINGLSNTQGLTPYAYALKLNKQVKPEGSDKILKEIIKYLGNVKTILLNKKRGIVGIPLFSSCIKRNADITQTLLDAGACVNVCNDVGCTLLHYLPAYYDKFCKGDVNHTGCFAEIYECLLEHNDIDVNVQDLKYGGSPLLSALKFKDMCLLDSLIRRKDIDLSLCDHHGDNVFHLFTTKTESLKEFICLKQLFLKFLKKVNKKNCSLLVKQNENDATPLHTLVQALPTFTPFLIEKVAACFDGDAGKYFNILDKDGFSPLHYALSSGYISSVVLLLLARGAGVIKTKSGATCADIVEKTMRGLNGITDQACTEVLRMLEICQQRDSAAYFSVDDLIDEYGNTYLHIAAKQGQYFVAKMLLMMGASAVKTNKLKRTPLSSVPGGRDHRILKQLLARAVLKEVERIAAGGEKH